MPTFLFYEDQEFRFDWGDQENTFNFLTLKKKMFEERKSFDDITVCFRFNLLSYKSFYPRILYVQNDRHVNVSHAIGTAQWWNAPMIRLNFGPSPPGNGWIVLHSFPEAIDEVIAADGIYAMWPIYKKEINANEWHSFCFGYDINLNIMYLVHNGQTQENKTQPEIVKRVDKGWDTSIVEPYTQNRPFNWSAGLDLWKDSEWFGQVIGDNINPLFGYFTDYQIFGKSLSAQEMYDITSCKSFKEGDIYAFNVDDWKVWSEENQARNDSKGQVNYRVVNISRSDLCPSQPKYTFFPDTFDVFEQIDNCRRFGGELIDVSTVQQRKDIVEFSLKNVIDNPKMSYTSVNSYTMYNDEEEFNVWKHRVTGEVSKDPMIWGSAEPNGGMVENCQNIWIVNDPKDESIKHLMFNDNTCTARLHGSMCQNVGEVLITQRGMCEFSKIDKAYLMVDGDRNTKRFFTGNNGWEIVWDGDNNHWRMNNTNDEYKYATHSDFVTYPLGKRYWKIVNESRCSYPDPDRVLLNMSPCNDTEFTCDDGSCVPMTKRLV